MCQHALLRDKTNVNMADSLYEGKKTCYGVGGDVMYSFLMGEDVMYSFLMGEDVVYSCLAGGVRG